MFLKRPPGHSPVEGVEWLLTALHIALKRFLVGVNTDVDLQAVGRQEGFATSFLVACEYIFTWKVSEWLLIRYPPGKKQWWFSRNWRVLQKSHNAPSSYATMHHFVTEMCTCVHISVTKRCIAGHLSNALWDLQLTANKYLPYFAHDLVQIYTGRSL